MLDEVQIFLLRPEALAEDGAREAARAILTDDEHARLARFHFDRDRDVALASRALERRTLSAWCPAVAPSAWRFAPDDAGRPRVVAPAVDAPAWNVANTIGLVVCAVTRGRAIGVDVEPARADAPPEIVESHFAVAERAALRALPAADQPRRFVELWTLKEAYVKARGAGLALPLDRFACDPATAPPGLAIDDVLADDPARWQLAQWWPLPTHCLALCVERGARPAAISVRWA